MIKLANFLQANWENMQIKSDEKEASQQTPQQCLEPKRLSSTFMFPKHYMTQKKCVNF